MTPALAEALRAQAAACAALGSPLTAEILGQLAEPGVLPATGALARRLLDFGPGSAADLGPSGASVPLRLAGGLHRLVLGGEAPGLGRAYGRGIGLDRALRDALCDHDAFLADWIDSPPQTNEVRRSAVLIAAGHWLAARHGLPLELSELGASAGLNLLWDRYRLEVPGGGFGPGDAALRLSPDWRGDLPPSTPPRVAGRAGVDLNPLDPLRDRLRILSYIWPDQPDRLERTRAALDEAARLRPRVDRGDAAAWLAARLAQPMPGRLHLVFHTVAWQYFPPDTREACRDALAEAGARATPGAPIARFGMEADDRPGDAALSLTIWPGGQRIDLGRADFHGRRVDWRAPPLDGAG